MRETVLPDGRRRIVYDYRGPNGPNHVRMTLPAHTRIGDIVKAKAELVTKAERRSLKYQVTNFEDVVDIVTKQNDGAGMDWVYTRVRSDLAGPMDSKFVSRYNRYIDTLQDEGKSMNTISNHKSVIQRILNTAWKRRLIDDIPVRDFGIKREFRDRVLSPEERLRLENVMIKNTSHLYWSIRFAERRPIRGKSDIWKLTRNNLVLFGEGAPYIRLSAKKTGLNTVVPLSDMPDILDYFNQGLPNDCPFLFPRLEGAIESVFDFKGMGAANWFPMGDPKKHFSWLLANPEKNQTEKDPILDFHFHDFKRIATTHMLANGYTAEDLMDLGFYASRDMIDRCYKKRDSMSILRRISVGANVGDSDKQVSKAS